MPIDNHRANPGDLITSESWNAIIDEIKLKPFKSGDSFSGPLQVNATTSVRSLNIIDAAGNVYPNNWIGMANNIEGTTKWLHIGGIEDAGARRMALFADRTHIAGNVGIGVTNPQSQLHIRGGNWDVANTNGDLKIGNDNFQLRIGVALAGSGAGDVRIRARGGSNRMMLGVGADDTLTITNNTIGLSANCSLYFGNQTRQMLNLWGNDYGIGVQSSTLYFRSNNHFAWFHNGVHHNGTLNSGAGGTRLMRLEGNGNLHVEQGKIYARSGSDVSLAANSGFIIVGDPNGFHLSIDPNEIMAKSNGTTPSGLSLNAQGGHIYMGNSNSRVYMRGLRNIGDRRNVQYNDTTNELGWDNSSRRHKENIKPLEADFRNLLKLQPRTYTRPENPDRWEIGYIAEEVESLGLSSLVYYDKEGLPDGLNYEKFCLFIIEVLRDHEAALYPDSPFLTRYMEEIPVKQKAANVPTTSSTKVEIQAYLDQQGISYTKRETKAKLLDKLK